LRDLANHREPLDALGYSIVTPVVSGQHLEGTDLVAAMSGCIGVVAGDDKFTADVLAQLPDLRVISKWGVGIDGIDLDAAAERGIVVRNTPGMFDDEVADVTMAYVVNLLRGLAEIDRGVRAGSWPKPAGRSLRGLTLGVIGLGGIGRAVARRAMLSGMNVIGSDPSDSSCRAAAAEGVACCDLDDLWSSAEVISVNCPLNDATHHLINQRSISAMRDGVFIVNTGRGSVVETSALLEGLRSGKIAGAALDVLEVEPLPGGHPLAEFDQVMFGSHNASNTLDASARVSEIAISHLIDELSLLR
jgi:D-3-phosphoglycerate dehydrogenase